MARGGREMRRVLIRTGLKGIMILIGILLISTILQFMIWVRGPELISEMVLGLQSEEYPGQNEQYRRQAIDSFREAMGWTDRFVPDLWPFDNESLWH